MVNVVHFIIFRVDFSDSLALNAAKKGAHENALAHSMVAESFPFVHCRKPSNSFGFVDGRVGWILEWMREWYDDGEAPPMPMRPMNFHRN